MKGFRRKCGLLALPVFAGFLLFYILPFALTVRYSFVRSAFDQSFVWWENYHATYQNEYFRLAMKNTALFTVISVPLLVSIALLLGLMLYSYGKEHSVIRMAFVLPILLPSVTVAKVYVQLFADISPGLPVVLMFIWKNLGFHLVLIMAAMAMTDKSVYEAAELDGARGLTKLIKITIPMIKGTLFFCTVLGMSQSLRIYREVYLMYGAYPSSDVYFLQHFMNNHFAKLNYQTLAASAITFAVVLFGLVAVAVRQEHRMEQ